jgi:probable HAF family extracellular repeat protein
MKNSLVILALLLFSASLLRAQSTVDPFSLTFNTIDVPGAVATNVDGINTNGDMVGGYSDSTGDGHGFLYANGIFTFFDYPGQYRTYPWGINDSGVISGSAWADDGSNIIGFLYAGSSFSTIQVPGKAGTSVQGINNASTVVGGVGAGLEATQGFALAGTKFRNITPPGTYTSVHATGINNVSQVVGWTTGSTSAGFFYSKGKFKTISFPGSTMTSVWSINDSGMIVGWYEGCSPSCAFHGFVGIQGKYASLDYPGASATFAFGINASGQIVGAYTLNGVTHGFVTSPAVLKTYELPVGGK